MLHCHSKMATFQTHVSLSLMADVREIVLRRSSSMRLVLCNVTTKQKKPFLCPLTSGSTEVRGLLWWHGSGYVQRGRRGRRRSEKMDGRRSEQCGGTLRSPRSDSFSLSFCLNRLNKERLRFWSFQDDEEQTKHRRLMLKPCLRLGFSYFLSSELHFTAIKSITRSINMYYKFLLWTIKY